MARANCTSSSTEFDLIDSLDRERKKNFLAKISQNVKLLKGIIKIRMLLFPAKAVAQSKKETLFYDDYYLLFINSDTMLLIVFRMECLKSIISLKPNKISSYEEKGNTKATNNDLKLIWKQKLGKTWLEYTSKTD